jgi:hypothetical protein
MIDQYPPANGVLTSLIWRKTAAGGETSLSGYDNASQALSYTPGQEQVYLNGILLVRGDDYTATNGTSITGLSALSASDFVQVNCYNNFSLASLPSTSITGEISNSQITSLATSKLTGTISNAQLAGSISNDKLANSSITINGSAVSLGGSVSLPGDIESVTASSPLTGGGTSGAVTIGIQSASTTQLGAVQLTDSTSSTSTSTAATPNSVKTAYDLANGAIQKTLTTTTGDIIYASAANTPARLGIGSSGQILTVNSGIPSWTTPSVSGGGLVYINTLTVSSATTAASIDSVFSSTYDNYFITATIDSLAGQTNLTIKLRSGGSDTSANYYSGRFYVNNEGYGFNIDSSGIDEWEFLMDGTGASSIDKGAANIWLYYPNKAEKTRFSSISTSWDNQGEPQTQLGHGVQSDTTQFTGIKFISGSNMTGVFTIYGFAKS